MIKFSDRAQRGLLETRTCRATGTCVSLIDAREALDFDPREGGRWVTFCEEHGTFCQHYTRRLAASFMAAPDEWCELCRKDDHDQA